MTIQNPTASDLAAFVQDQDQKNSDLALRAKAMSDLPRIDPTWVRDWQGYMTRYAQARERANAKVAASAGAELDSVPAQGEFEALQRAVKPYEAAQSTGDFDDLSARLRRASSAPRGTGARLTWSQIPLQAQRRRHRAGAAHRRAGRRRRLPRPPGLPGVQRPALDGQAHAPDALLPRGARRRREPPRRVAREVRGGAPVHFGGVPSGVSSLLASDVPKYVGAGGVALLLANTLGAGLLGSLAAAAGGVALAAWAISHPRSQAA